jgi:hypothetical protein
MSLCVVLSNSAILRQRRDERRCSAANKARVDPVVFLCRFSRHGVAGILYSVLSFSIHPDQGSMSSMPGGMGINYPRSCPLYLFVADDSAAVDIAAVDVLLLPAAAAAVPWMEWEAVDTQKDVRIPRYRGWSTTTATRPTPCAAAATGGGG